jgi:hypothetical protein
MKPFILLAAAVMLAPFAAVAAEDAAKAAAPKDAAKTEAPHDAAEHAKRWAACSAEITKFCASAEQGRGKTRACLEPHAAELSDGCKARMAEKHEKKPN